MKSIARFLGIGSDKANQEPTKVILHQVPDITVQEELASAAVVVDETPEGEILHVRQEDVRPNPFQPRKTFHEESLQELAASIREFGILQPLIVRKTADGLELIAGERRLRASILAELPFVPVIVRSISDKEMAELAMIENLQREDLHFLEEAEGYQLLISQFGLTQDEMAKRVGKSQSTVANKLRLLKLEPDVRASLREFSLTERHARALLKLETPQTQREMVQLIRDKGLNVRETETAIEEIVENISREKMPNQPRRNVIRLIKDVRIFINTINSLVSDMKKAGLLVNLKQEQDDEYVTLTMKIPKKK
ncbi:nucleoid occlusion protein [Anaerosporomusa subterranea]|uniref:Nucleoid occlusion protein n=1 Tax=Anaerosporomusa subterranea TaxID=1794912 RepID=A0A154BP96_ANASB|nr:nucleoid occlusion protein [Anaerosporomusa subterranea]KYZ75719.1 nucleoid occlusion protein [Anaerosporomusa subterranea]